VQFFRVFGPTTKQHLILVNALWWTSTVSFSVRYLLDENCTVTVLVWLSANNYPAKTHRTVSWPYFIGCTFCSGLDFLMLFSPFTTLSLFAFPMIFKKYNLLADCS